ncbi:hypothetical protein ES703_100218 [subsurface metagenome]
MNQFELKSPAFTDGGALPKKYTIDGEKVSPPLEWANAPEGTRSLVLVMTDSDAPLQMFPGVIVHWVVCDIPEFVNSIGEGLVPAGARQLRTTYADFGMSDFAYSYGPPWPPDKAHRYVFTLYALRSESLYLAPDIDYASFMKALLPEIIASTTLVGVYGPAETPLPRS